MRNCTWVKENAIDFIDGLLDESATRDLLEHLQNCQECAGLVEGAQDADAALLQASGPKSEAPLGEQALREARPARDSQPRLIRMSIAAGVAFMVLMAGAGWGELSFDRGERAANARTVAEALERLPSEFESAIKNLTRGRVDVAFEALASIERALERFPSVSNDQLAGAGALGHLRLIGIPAHATVVLERIPFRSFFGWEDEFPLERIELREPFAADLQFGCYRVAVRAQGYEPISSGAYLFILPANSDEHYRDFHQRTLNFHLATAGTTPAGMVLVPAGDFVMGSNDWQRNEGPRHIAYTDTFLIDRTEVPIRAFMRHAAQVGFPLEKKRPDPVLAAHDLPMTWVRWEEADRYSRLIGKRLPTELEWEKAAAGPRGYAWPWGNETDSDYVARYVITDRRNTGSVWNAAQKLPDDLRAALERSYEKDKHPFPVSTLLEGDPSFGKTVMSPYGCLHMHGNVWEWVSDTFAPYPLSESPGAPGSDSQIRNRRGGSYNNPADHARAQNRSPDKQAIRWSQAGFRCAMSVR